MRRFVIKHDEQVIEGVMFSDGFIVIHGLFFKGLHISSKWELESMFQHADIEWLDEEE